MEPIQQLNDILKSFNIKANCVNYKKTDNYFYYDVTLQPHVRVRDIQKFGDEISMALKTPGKPNIKVIHEEGVVRLEFVTKRSSTLKLFDYFTIDDEVPDGDLICLLGQDISGERVWMDLAKNPHMIVAGTTGSGKSTLVHNIIANILNYNNAYLFLIDPKGIEFSEYEKHPINNIQVGYTYADTIKALNNLLTAMEYRYELLRQGISPEKIPYAVLIIDEFADLIMQDKDEQFYTKLCQLAQKCRAARISIILATQRPSVNVIDGTIKANFPARIACRVASHIDSRVILDAVGAENLFGQGDALLRDNVRFLDRFQVAYTDAKEVCEFFSKSHG
jgi:DNA segregation ATPase FtsK/SpoIIIE, S-DNA-T family